MKNESKTRTISFGKVPRYGGKGRKDCEIEVTLELKDGEYGPCFSESAKVWNGRHTQTILAGQCLDTILLRYGKYLEASGLLEQFKVVYCLWDKWHLNELNAGTLEQEKAIIEKFGRESAAIYKEEKDYLKQVGLYEVPWTDEVKCIGFSDKEKPETYCYGSGWLYREIDPKDLDVINAIMDRGMEYLSEVVKMDKEAEEEIER